VVSGGGRRLGYMGGIFHGEKNFKGVLDIPALFKKRSETK